MDTHLKNVAETPPSETSVGRIEAQLAKAVGLKQFGVNQVTLAPGAISALRHWHEQEDEFVLVLSGEITLIDENGAHSMRAGDYVGFPAGAPNGHHLKNLSDAAAMALVIGTRKVGQEVVHYPDDAIGAVRIVRDGDGNRIATVPLRSR